MQALAGFRVIDIGYVLAGPLVTQFMADMGAEVIKVESRTRLDGTRRGRPIVGEDIAGGDRGLWPELSPLFHCINRNKLGLTVDLRTPDGLAVVHDLVRVSDVVLNNNAPGVMDRLGLGYETLKSLNPDIVMVSMPGVGDEGPLKDVLAYASITSALSGLMGLIGYPPGDGSGGEGLLAGQIQGAWGDVIASLTGIIATLAALRHRRLTGEGQYIEVAQLEAAVSLLGEAVMEFEMAGQGQGNRGTRHSVMVPHGNYPCQGEDKWVSIVVQGKEEWRALCAAMGNPAWTREPEFEDPYLRSLRTDELDRHIARWTGDYTPQEVTEILQQAGVAAMPVMNIEDQFTDPHYRERDVFVESEHPMVGTEWLPGIAWGLSETPGSVRDHAPFLGQHNKYVIQEVLGYTEERYQELEKSEALV